jgi:hypothetical protein
VFGQVDINRMPFSMSISGEHGPVRASIAMAHEMAHVADQMLKLGMSHDKVHSLGEFYFREGLPALESLKRFLNNNRAEEV